MAEKIACRCPHCGASFRVRSEYAGRKGKCPAEGCGRPVRVPQASEAPEPPAKPAPKPKPRRKPAPAPPPMLPPLAAAAPKRRARKAPADSGAAVKTAAAIAGLLAAAGGVFAMTRGGEEAPDPVAVAPAVVETTPVAVVERPTFAAAVRPFLEANCLDCHSGDEPEGDFNLAEDATEADVLKHRAKWEKALELVEIGAMPPADFAEPSEDEVAPVVEWLDHSLYFVDCEAQPDPGRVTVRRLNRTEYDNTVRDLFGVDFEPSRDFPSDEVGYGFDNIGDVLTVPPLLLEKYLDAAEQVADKAIHEGDPDLRRQLVAVPELRGRKGGWVDESGGRVTVGTSGNMARAAGLKFPRSGKYTVNVELSASQGGPEPARFAVKANGHTIHEFEVTAHETPETVSFEHRMDAGEAVLDVEFLNDWYHPKRGDRNGFVYSVEVVGPYGVDASNLPGSHEALLANRPGPGMDAQQAAAANLAPLLRRAFRTKVSADDVGPYARFAARAVDDGATFESAMKTALQAVLVSPRFLFRIEGDDGSTGRLARPLTGFELASRLSYFLWNSTPDDRLLELAEGGSLTRDAVLEGEIARMLADDRSDEMIENFSGQWLGLRKLRDTTPDPEIFKDFDEDLREAMGEETRRFVRHVVRENRPVTELISARYTFLNERLARHYGVGGVNGEHFRRVELTDGLPEGQQRAGLITHGSILMLTSYATRTSPVRRGEWVLANILGDEPPPAPPNVPTLEETQEAHGELSLREQMAKHREDPSCAACHKTMDAIGFGLENFDATGAWRDADGKFPVDAAGELPAKRGVEAASFEGSGELIEIIAGREEAFVRCVAEKLMTFALGRGVTYRDRCELDAIVEAAAADGNRFNSIVKALVMSRAFRQQGGG